MHDPNTSDWTKELEPKLSDISIFGWCIVVIRAVLMLLIILVGIVLLFIARGLERPLVGLCRPVSGQVVNWVCRIGALAIGLRMSVRGTPMTNPGAIVANHSSWLDIIVLNAAKRVFFVSKAEVSSWPGIGFLANITGTVFIRRERRDSKLQKDLFQTRLGLGHKLLFFPEGTSTDSLRVLPFKSTLFAAFFEPKLKEKIYIQAVTVNYHAPKNQDKRFYGWWGEMDFGTHLLQSLSALPQGHVEVVFHKPRALKDYHNRKVLTADLERDVRSAHAYDGKY
ncbi:MAG: lysophospholipid acyltransferase family protein [Paracoccaceae bacterium]|jgi:1-acyl-sn-glycerol-3-phosphate acyltransferase